MTIDFDRIEERVARVPVEADNYFGLAVKTGHLLYGVGSAFYYGREGDRKTTLKIYSLKDRKETTLLEDVGGYALSNDGGKLLVRQGPNFALYDAVPGGDKSRKAVSTSGLVADRVPAEEWNQIFNEVWRRYRDWFYVEREHARLRLGGAARAVPPAPTTRRAQVRP
jgi:tricorn protease